MQENLIVHFQKNRSITLYCSAWKKVFAEIFVHFHIKLSEVDFLVSFLFGRILFHVQTYYNSICVCSNVL